MNTPEEKLKQVEGKLQQLEDKLMKLNDEYDAKKAKIELISTTQNNTIKNIKEKKATSTKIFQFLGVSTANNTKRRLNAAKEKLKQKAYDDYMYTVEGIKKTYQQYEKIKNNLELEIQRDKENLEQQVRNIKNKEEKNTIEKQKLNLITRYKNLGYTYVPEHTKYGNFCAGMPPQATEYMDCKSLKVKDSFQYITETQEKPTDGDWKEEQQTITIPAKYEERVIPGTQGNYGYQGYGKSSSSETVKVADEREEEVSVWKRPLPAGFPEKVEYNDFLTVIEKLESKPKNVQSRKRKQNRRKSMKARKN